MKKVFVKFLLCFGMVLCFFTSCEIGLGAQVDVEPPSVVMESPTENARTRKTVTFSGTWTDDLEIKQVTVELKKTTELTDVKESFSFIANTTNNGDDKTKGTWSYCLDTEVANIPDGAYTVIATAEDTYGHTNQVSTVITIDNTPPLIVLESPSTTEISSPMSYGKTFSIIGRGADEQNGGTVDSIDAVIYDENNVEIARKTFTNISTSIDFKIADWDEASEQGNNFYKTIYGIDENAGTKNYYVELIAYDDARKVPAEEGDRGNSTNIIYLNNTLSLIDGYKPSVAYNILNRSASSDSESALEKALKDKANQINKLTFSLNPVNNPYFEVQGYESLGTTANLEDERYSFLNKNKLTVNVYVGRDNKQIRPETVGIYLEPCDVNGNVTGSSKVTLLEPGAISSSGAITDKAVYTEEFKYSSASCTWTSKSLDVETIDGLEIGKYYKITVTAQDYNGVNIRNSNQYAIKITTVNSAPIIIINEPGASLTIAKSAAYTVKGVVKTSSKITKIRLYKNEFVEANYQNKEYVVNASETINDSGVAALKDKIVLNTSQTTVSQRYYNFSFEVDGISDSDYTLVVVAFDDNNQYAQKEISIENDVNEPTFDDSPTITPLISSEISTGRGIYKVNGTVSISELISDDKKVAGSWWSVSDTMPDATKDEGWNAGNLDGSSATNLKFSIDTTQLADKSERTVYFRAKDKSGNINTDGSILILKIDQSTDAPVVELSNTNANTNQAAKDYPELDYNNEWDEEAYLKAKQSQNRTVFGTKSNNEMLGTISDDDGIESVKVYYQKISLKTVVLSETNENGDPIQTSKNVVEVGDEPVSIPLDTSPNGKTTYSLKAKMPSDQGTYLITIKVKDSKQDKTGYNSTTIGPFLVAVDDGAPKLKIETASGGFKTKTFEVKGTIDDTFAKLYKYSDKDCTKDKQEITIGSDGKWTDSITITNEEGAEIYYKAVDDYNQESIESFSYKYDAKEPVYKIETIKGEPYNANNSQFYGTIDGSYFMITGLVSDYFYQNSEGKEEALYDKDGDDYKAENVEKSTSGFSESDFYYFVTDKQITPPESKESYDISTWSTCKITPLDSAGYIGKWTAAINFKELKYEDDNTLYIYFAAKDNAGNVSVIKENDPVITVTIDSKAPTVGTPTVTIASEPVITISVSDNVKINKEKLELYNNNTPLKQDEKTEKKDYSLKTNPTEDGKTATFTITLRSVPAGENKYTVNIYDDAGNKATSNAVTINNVAPKFSSTDTGIADGAYKEEKNGNQYSYITREIAASATVTCSDDNNQLATVTWKDTYLEVTGKDENGNDTFTDTSLATETCTPEKNGKITILAEKISKDTYENKFVTRTVTATNVYGQSSTWTYYFVLDSEKPELLANSTGDITTLDGKNITGLSTVWLNKDTLEIKGAYKENGSGIKQIDYILTTGNEAQPQKGTIYTSGSSGEKENFSSIISGFSESSTGKNNTLTLTATDKAGNVSDKSSFYIQIDTTAPSLKEKVAPDSAESSTQSKIWYRFADETPWKQYENSILTNNSKDLELTGYFEDLNTGYEQSGIKEIKIDVNVNSISAQCYSKAEADTWTKKDFTTSEKGSGETKGYWFVTINKENLGLGGTVNAKITISDNAGNTDSTNSINILVDTISPTVSVEMPSANSTLNGKNTFSGKVNDTNDVKSIALYYATTTCPTTVEGFTEITNCSKDTDNAGVSMSDISAWKFIDVDVNELIDIESGKTEDTVYLLAVAYDKAGNCNVNTSNILEKNCTKITVDLDSDRPIIKFNNLSGTGNDVYLNATELKLTLTDDDGISKLHYSFNNWTTEKEATVSSGSATIPLDADGEKSMYFKITDTAGGTFTTGDTTSYKQPYVIFEKGDKNDNNSAITFTKDTIAPSLTATNYGFASTSNEALANSKGEVLEGTKQALAPSNIAGGSSRKFVAFEVQANDGTGSGIATVTLNYTNGTNSNTELLSKDETTNNWYTTALDVSDLAGSYTLTFTVTDKAGLSVTQTKQFTIDNAGPAITLITPEKSDTQTGVVTLAGTANDEYSKVQEVRYLVLNDDYYSAENVIDDEKAKTDVKTVECSNSGSPNTWKFILDGQTTDSSGNKNPKLPASDEELKNYTKVTHDEKDIYTMDVYIYTKDALGNESFTKNQISYNPYGDRPTTEVTFPTSTKGSENNVTPANVNGSIRITGAAQDNVSVKEVYVQIDMNKDGDFTEADKKLLEVLKDGETPIYTIVESVTNADYSAIGGDTNFWGIKANGTNSWNLTINQYGEMMINDETNGNKISDGKYQINIRAVAVDNNYTFGNWSETQYVIIDNNIPIIGKQKKNIKEYDSDGTTLKSTKAYTTDMYVKGKAKLELSVEDVNGIKQVMYYTADTEEGLASATGTKYTLPSEQTEFTGGTKGYILEIPLSEGSTTSGSVYVKVVATKNSDTETTAYEKFSVNFDNSAPVINKITLNGVNHADSDKKIVNSNGTYFTFGGSVTDDGGSGFDKVLFYYYREGKNGNPNRIYDPMIDSTSEGKNNDGRVNVSNLKTKTLAGQNLYGTEQSVTIESDKRKFTISEDSHIRAGGVVEINGTWLTIEKIESTTVTLKSDAPVTGQQTVFFAYAQVIDNTGSEKTDANGDLSSGDDGDGMAESIIKSLNTWTYDATFHSNYIPDGPGKLVVFAFDKAGNVSANSYEASVQNNAPRLTRVMLATDLNGNGTYEYYSDSVEGPINNLSDKATANGTEFGEFAFYSTLNNKGEASNIAEVTLPTGRDPFIVKNNLLVVPEFTGGNGELSYTYKIFDDLASAGITTISEGKATEKFAEASASKIVNKEGTNVNFDSSQSKEFEITNGVLEKKESWTSTEKLTRYLATTFWDSTEETTPGVDSCYALLKMPLIINVKDDTKPTATITPFYWNSKEDSSFVYDENGNPLGHIDLPADAGEKPGVSGQVYIEGTAWDDTRLGSISIKGPGDNDDFVELATFTNGNWTCKKGFEILENYGITQSGHTVKWRYKMDMTPYGIGEDKVVTVKAKDAMTEPNVSDITTSDSKYTMDFVPYIKSIYPANESSANRSRLGKFPVRAGEDIIIEGMNFAKDASYEVKFYKSGDSGKIGTEQIGKTISGTINTDGQITVMAPDYSSWVEVEVNGVATKNNKNVNDGYNIEAGYVAKDTDLGAAKAASAGTNFWTDDRYISVWSVATSTLFPGSINPHSGAIKKIDKYNSGSGAPTTVDGSIAAEGPGGGYLYKQDGDKSAVDPVKEMNDSFYAAISSDDLKLYGYVSGKTYTGHGDNIGFASSEVAYVAPVDEMDYTIINGTPYYVIQDNGLGGDSGSVWGLGLCLIREGIWYDRNYFNPYKGNTIEEEKLPFFIERQGYNTASHKRDSSTGYDSVLYQFKNPRIAGWYNENDSLLYSSANGGKSVNGVDYIYVSYYDSYAKCLKYAGFRAGHRFVSNDSKLVTSDLKDWGKIDVSNDIDIVAEMTSSPNRKKGEGTPANSNQPAQKAFDHMTDGAAVVAGNETTSNNPTYTEIAGEWSDIFVDTTSSAGPRPVIVYYNKTNKSLEVAYGNNSFPQATSDWTKTTSIRPNGVTVDFGRYVSAAMDKNGNLHVAAQDADNARLYYLYLTKSGSSYSVTNSVAVDASNGAGRWTDIELTDPEGTSLKAIKPVISYIDTSYLGTTSGIKVAYLEDEVDGSLSFEAITDPAYYTAGDQRTSVMSNVKETKGALNKSPVAVGFNSDMLVLDFLRGEK